MQFRISGCSDCGTALVDSLEEAVEYLPFFQAENKKIADKLVSYFQYSGLPSELSYDNETEVYVLSIPPKQEKQARKLYQAFYYVERENIEKGIYKDEAPEDTEGISEADTDADVDGKSDPDDQDPAIELLEEGDEETPGDTEEDILEEETSTEAPEDRGAYIFKEDRHKDLAGTVWIFLFFGIAGLIFVILNMAGFLTVLNGWIPNTVMGALFLFFLYVAVTTNTKAKSLKAEIAEENKLTEDINRWLKEHLTKDYLASIYNDAVSEELNYIKMTDAVRALLLEQFGPQNLSYLDRLIEEYYNSNFDQ
jgi:hypothetical protein